MKKYLYIFIALLTGFLSARDNPKYEMRGVWIAVVKNIDWPSSNTTPPEQQKKELISILDQLQKNNINSIFFQVRTECDAVYFSDIEPFSKWIEKGDYDPLAFIISEAHKRGMELHAWFNPFRSVFNTEEGNISNAHISKTHPEWNITYGKQKWLNPGLPDVRNYVVRIIEDVIKRYNIDGVHFDDYFYPYPQKKLKFNDNNAYKKYSSKNVDRNEWRRGNINSLIKAVSEKVKELKPDIKFGVSPFGIWKNKSSDPEGSNTNGSESYESIYADSKLWLKEGWVDYIAPQIYWNMNNSAASYKELVKWWSENSYGRDVYVGMSVYKIGSKDLKNPEWDNISHFIDEIKLNRSCSNIKGSIFFNTSSFLKNPLGLSDSLSASYFKEYIMASVRGENYIVRKPAINEVQISGFRSINHAVFNVLKKDKGIYKVLVNVKEKGFVSLVVFDKNGIELKNLSSGIRESGFYELYFEAGNYSGNCYFRLISGGHINTYKIRI